MIFTKRFWQEIILALLLLLSLPLQAKSEAQNQLSDQDIVDAYNYYLGRLLVLRQEQLDFTKNGFKWNQVIHREPGQVEWANPNLDVAYSEAWIAVDKKNCTMVEVPKISGRYYTVQLLNGWGETVSNINERTFPAHPDGKFAYCLKEASVNLPAGTERINIPGDTGRILARIELGKDPKQAIALQKQLKIYSTGKPHINEPPKITLFPNDKLPGADSFMNAQTILTSDPDINEGMANLQANVMNISRAIADPKEKARINDVITKQAIPDFKKYFATLGSSKNGWSRPSAIGNYGSDYRARTVVNFAGIWANNNSEAVYFKTGVDSDGKPLNGSNHYTMTFAKDELPKDLAKYFWSVIAVDSDKFQVLPNMLKRYLLNKESKLAYNKDGSLTLIFSNRLPINMPESNWLPTPMGETYNLTFRFYGPSDKVLKGGYFPPPLVKQTSDIASQRVY